jgi:hypothetical protein
MAATGFHTADELNALLPGTLPGLLGLTVTAHEPGRLAAALDVRPECCRRGRPASPPSS